MRSHTNQALPFNETWPSREREEIDEIAKAHLMLACVCPMFGKPLDTFSASPFSRDSLPNRNWKVKKD